MFQVGAAAAEAVEASIRRAVCLAEGLEGIPAVKDLKPGLKPEQVS
ncbi:MAG: hypothetical protein H5T84_01250 [Thermoleophilia bacterium]|nr:hypothetical protein [Thermoleophilia bacterium]